MLEEVYVYERGLNGYVSWYGVQAYRFMDLDGNIEYLMAVGTIEYNGECEYHEIVRMPEEFFLTKYSLKSGKLS